MGGVGLIPFNANEIEAQLFGHGTCCTCAKKRIEDDVTGIARRKHHALQQGFRLLCGMHLVAIGIFQAFAARAQGQRPVGAHLRVIIENFHGFVMETIFGFLPA